MFKYNFVTFWFPYTITSKTSWKCKGGETQNKASCAALRKQENPEGEIPQSPAVILPQVCLLPETLLERAMLCPTLLQIICANW